MKQKVILGLTVVAFGYLGYQLYELITNDLGGSVAQVNTPRVVKADPPSAPKKPFTKAMQTAATITDNSPAMLAAKPSDEDVNQHMALLRNQRAYLKLVSEYELAKMKRQLLQERVAIAEAQSRIAKLNGGDSSFANVGMDDSVNQVMNDSNFKLSYIDHQQGKWSATLYHGGHYQTVFNGSELSDGYKVVNVNRDGVLLQYKDKRELITFNGVKMVAMPKPQPVVETKAAPVIKPIVINKPKLIAKPNSELTLVPIKIVKPVKTAKPVAKKPLKLYPPALIQKPAHKTTIKLKSKISLKPKSNKSRLAAKAKPKAISTAKPVIHKPVMVQVKPKLKPALKKAIVIKPKLKKPVRLKPAKKVVGHKKPVRKLVVKKPAVKKTKPKALPMTGKLNDLNKKIIEKFNIKPRQHKPARKPI
ncbi:MAG: hypothetical protein K0U12_07860, partial [Gammaproteobacteria bacterium]|nr:hypothetical protein [Gammaproteobacteria bacterium]